MEIYYDPTDGVLMAQNSQGEWGVVKTNAQLDPQRIALDAEGFMYIAGLDGKVYIVSGFDGNPISLKGEPGPAGKDGVSPKVNLSEDGILQIEDSLHTISANIKGPKGEQGLQGLQGEKGNSGIDGKNGTDGKDGADGKDGKTYIPTVDLDGTLFWKIDEPTEIPQAINIKGPKGDVGEKGDMGEKGADGLTFTPSVSEDGVLSWTNSGNVLNPQPVSIKGPQGEKGEKGEQGPQGEKGLDGQTPVFEISDGSLKYKIGEQDWTSLITDKSIFTQPDI